jgi:hypothetical protein
VTDEQYQALRASHLRWKESRHRFLILPAGHPDAKTALNELAEAEDALYKIKTEETNDH